MTFFTGVWGGVFVKVAAVLDGSMQNSFHAAK